LGKIHKWDHEGKGNEIVRVLLCKIREKKMSAARPPCRKKDEWLMTREKGKGGKSKRGKKRGLRPHEGGQKMEDQEDGPTYE